MRLIPADFSRRAAGALAVMLAALAWAAAAPSRAADPGALWHIVHDLCVPNMRGAGDPSPCTAVDLAGGHAVLKDIHGATQLLLIPTQRLPGIESPRLLAPGSPNYWQAAWAARGLLERRAGREVPRQDLGLAINSRYARSQNQLHIHIDCVRPDVQAALRANAGRIGRGWTSLALGPRRYRARRLDGSELGTRDPFKILAASDPKARSDMGAWTLAVVGTVFPDRKPGFVLVADRAEPSEGDIGGAEELLDHDCAVLGPARAAEARTQPRG
ncbi:MAG: CDP-diacylglycerol diphosphatase [Caulobacteraceae bacterium]|nr:CDP-diacylglycerol diphosphatase [Caulobacteraceae bacterium]